MQDVNIKKFKVTVGKVIKELREVNTNLSINKLANSYGFDKGNLSKIEHGIYGIQLATAWKLSEAMGIKFSDFAVKLEEKLGKDFTMIDD